MNIAPSIPSMGCGLLGVTLLAGCSHMNRTMAIAEQCNLEGSLGQWQRIPVPANAPALLDLAARDSRPRTAAARPYNGEHAWFRSSQGLVRYGEFRVDRDFCASNASYKDFIFEGGSWQLYSGPAFICVDGRRVKAG